MRYVVQVLTLGRAARAHIQDVSRERLIEQADVTPSFIQGMVGEDALRRLLELGLEVSVVARTADSGTGARGPAGVIVNGRTARSFGIAGRGARQSYFELELKGLLTPAVRRRLSNLGMTILERMADRIWTVRLDGSQNAVRDDPAVERFAPADRPAPRVGAGLRTFGASGPALAAVPPGAPYEALLQPDAEPQVIAEALSLLGIEILSASGRMVRFIADPTQIERTAEVDGIVSVGAAGVPRVLDDMVRSLVGVTGPVDARPGGLDGEGEIVGIADTGIDIGHPDFADRIVGTIGRGRTNDASDPDGHGTHVAGILAGSGAASGGLLAGVAPRADIHFQSLLDAGGGLGGLPDDVGELFAESYAAGVRVHNDSWGIFLNARYPGVSLQVDDFVYAHPDFLPVVAAGNDGSCLPGLNVDVGQIDIPSMAAPGTSKNALVVGASRSSRADLGYARMTYGQAWPDSFGSPPISLEHVSGDPEGLAAFSARGPTDDHRIKPDVVAPGTDVVSAKSADAPLWRFWGSYPGSARYAVMGGTSMACPVVAGLALLVRQWYRRERDHVPSAALMRATIVNGTRALTGSDAVALPFGHPNFHQGFGRVDLMRSVPTPDCGFGLSFVDTLAERDLELAEGGDCVRFRFEVHEAGELRLCLAWSDPPGRGLQNSLFIALEEPSGALRYSNLGLATFMRLATPLPPGLPAGTLERDPNNNLHVLRVAETKPGAYEVTVASWDLIRPQGFALVVTGPVGDLIRVTDA